MVHRTLCFVTTFLFVVACSSSKGTTAPDTSDGGSPPSSSGGDPSGVPTGEPRVEYLGRTDTSDAAGPKIGWAGTKIVVRFQGTALSIQIAESEDTDGGSRYDVAIDGASTGTPLAPTNESTDTYEVAKDLADGTHVVVLTRRTEPQVGLSQFLSFDFPNGGKLLAPPAEPTRHIEFVGDSEMLGYGIECTDPSQSFSADTENVLLAYPSLVGASLNADVHNLGYSGKGVYRNQSPGGDVYPTYYPQAVADQEPTDWDFSWKPDVVWMALGANDYDTGGDDGRPAPLESNFEGAYRDLLTTVRTKNPDAKIVLVLQSFVNDDYPPGYQARTSIQTAIQAVVDEHHAAGDANVFFAELPRAADSDLTGCDSHPNQALHAKLAPLVSAKISAITGWK